MKNAKLYTVIIFLLFCFSVPIFSYAQPVERGCCILDINSTRGNPNNCVANTIRSNCTGAKSLFYTDDPTCIAETFTQQRCGTEHGRDEGCCILSTDESKFGPANCQANKIVAECYGTWNDSDANCSSLAPCKSNSNSGVNPSPGSGSGTSTTIEFVNPLRFSTVEEVLGSLLNNLQGIIVVLSIIFIIIGAILYITSAGDEKRIGTAKKAITASMIGLAIGIAAPSFLREISDVLGWNNPTGIPAATLSLTQIALNVLDFLLSIVGILAIIMLIVGGIMYLSSAGDEKRIDTGKKIVVYSIIGIVVAIASLVIVRQIAGFFS